MPAWQIINPILNAWQNQSIEFLIMLLAQWSVQADELHLQNMDALVWIRKKKKKKKKKIILYQ